MYPDVHFILSLLFLFGGLFVLGWSADRFIDGAAALAKLFGLSPFIVGMVIVGFGTSAPELCVSALSSAGGHGDLSIGNAYGSNIFNIAMILGIAALVRPIIVKPSVTFVAVPVLTAISVFSCGLVGSGDGFTRMDGLLTLSVFAILLPLYCWYDLRSKRGKVPASQEPENSSPPPSAVRSGINLVVGLALLIVSSHVLVWGAVDLARAAGVSELMIGLTVIAAGTSLPELASAVVSARKGEHDFVLGNIIGSNFFNTLAVVGLAGTLSPFERISPYILSRDLPAMVLFSLSIALFGVKWKTPRLPGRISRREGILWLFAFSVYLCFVIYQEAGLSSRVHG